MNCNCNVNPDILIPLVEERPALWDKNDPRYRDRSLKHKTWKEVARLVNDDFEKLDKSSKDHYCKMLCEKWGNIRDAFSRAEKKYRVKPCKPYLYREEMKFWARHQGYDTSPPRLRQKRRHIETRQSPDESSSEVDPIKKEVIGESDEETNDNDSPKNVFEVTVSPVPSPDHQESFDDSMYAEEPISIAKRKKVTTKGNNEFNKDTERSAVKSFELVSVQEEHPMLTFFKGIMPSIISFDEDETLEFQSSILATIQSIRRKRKDALI